MTRASLDACYFDGIFTQDTDPWGLASSDYEAAKFAHTVAVLADRRYARAIEIGCAHGVLTSRLIGLCDDLLAVDISAAALDQARARLGEQTGLTFAHMAFPGETPGHTGFDLVLLSEVAYYWSDDDLHRASAWLRRGVSRGGRVLLVHWTGETDYPQTGDGAVGMLWDDLAAEFVVERSERTDAYRLDLWTRR